jgi:hypothetical protein
MWDTMKAWLDRSGRPMYMGGNGWYWRIAFHDELPGAVELRRAEDGIRTWFAEPGEYFHSGKPFADDASGQRRVRRRTSEPWWRPQRSGPCRSCLRRDTVWGRPIRDVVDRLVWLPIVQQLRQQCGSDHPERP